MLIDTSHRVKKKNGICCAVGEKILKQVGTSHPIGEEWNQRPKNSEMWIDTSHRVKKRNNGISSLVVQEIR